MAHTYYKRVYVEDELPAFLRAKPAYAPPMNYRVPEMRMNGKYYGGDDEPVILSASQINGQTTATLENQKKTHLPAIHPDFQRSDSHLHPQTATPALLDVGFVLRLTAIIILLNGILYLAEAFGPTVSPPQRLAMQPDR